MEGMGAICKLGSSLRYRRRFFSFSVGTVISALFPNMIRTSSIMESNLASYPVLLAPL